MKRYTDPNQLIAKMDEYILERDAILEEVEDINHLADSLRNTIESHRIEGLRAKAQAKLLRANWRTRRLETMKQALAELRTPELPEISGDGGVAV